ncbi:MAG: efflux RND transporter periplasmic adaptor subunit [Candidatus Zixiibacteriota bacterium]
MWKRILPYVLVLALGIGVGIILSSPSTESESSHVNAATAPHADTDHGDAVHQDHAGEELSDLDRSVEELLSATCEHGVKTFECDECRYETGIVKAPAGLFEDGLLHTDTASRRRVETALTVTGEVRFDERRVAHVGAQVEGIIRDVHVVVGDMVRKGQALLGIESVAIGEAEADYLEAEAMLRLAQSNYEREAELRKKGFAIEREYLQSKQDFETTQIRANSALGKLTRLGMAEVDARALTQASANGRMVLRAPLDGTVLSVHGVSGEVVEVAEDLATIGDNSAVWVWADLYEQDMARLGQMQWPDRMLAVVTSTAYPGAEFPGTVDFISPHMEEVSRTVRVRVATDNPGGRLLDGMFVNVRILLPENEQALTLPETAVLEDEGRAFVFLQLQGNYYLRRPVGTGRRWADRIEIAEGLTGGEIVVADGSFLLKSDVLRSKMGAGCAD